MIVPPMRRADADDGPCRFVNAVTGVEDRGTERVQHAMPQFGQSAGVQRRLRCAASRATGILALALCCWALPGGAEPPKSISVELNKLEQEGGSCRVYLVITNPGTDAFSAFTLDLIVFEGGTIARRLAIELAPIRPTKTIVKVFDISQTACSDIGSILVNDVMHCRDVSGDVAECVDRIRTSSKLPVTLSK
jgi:hypothetical protein